MFSTFRRLVGTDSVMSSISAGAAPVLFPFKHKHRMGEHRTLKCLKWRVCGDAVVASERVTVLDICLQHEGRLISGQFPDVTRFRTTPTREDGLSRCSQIAHPIHDSIHGAYIALPIAFNSHYRDRTWLPAFAPTHGEQVHGVVPRS